MGMDFWPFFSLVFSVFDAKDRKSTADLSKRNLRDDKNPSLQSKPSFSFSLSAKPASLGNVVKK